jgi:hypothetical protein
MQPLQYVARAASPSPSDMRLQKEGPSHPHLTLGVDSWRTDLNREATQMHYLHRY